MEQPSFSTIAASAYRRPSLPLRRGLSWQPPLYPIFCSPPSLRADGLCWKLSGKHGCLHDSRLCPCYTQTVGQGSFRVALLAFTTRPLPLSGSILNLAWEEEECGKGILYQANPQPKTYEYVRFQCRLWSYMFPSGVSRLLRLCSLTAGS